MENPDLDLASSHSSDDEDDDNFAWDAVSPRQHSECQHIDFILQFTFFSMLKVRNQNSVQPGD